VLNRYRYQTTHYAKAASSKTLQFFLLSCILFVAAFLLSNQGVNAQTRPATNVPVTPTSTYPETSPNPVLPPTAVTAVPSANQSQYIISSGDVLDISVFGAPDLSQKAAVNNAGDVYMPLINYVHVAGMHAEDAQGAIEQAYLKNGVLKFPHVNIVITSYSSGVILMGEVGRTGIYPIVGAGKLFDILAEAGGTTASAGQIVTITHKSGGEPQTVYLTSDPVQSLAANVPVQQGDTIIVSKAGVIYVVGEVLAPSGFLMDEKGQYTVLKAVAMAHGLAKFAKPSKARIVRRTPEGEKEIFVPLDKILVSKTPDIAMQANDILFVPSSKGKEAASRTVDVAVALASGVAYYGFYH
jgi:polysaccharide biosynthesis/export protein